ncbi:MAG: hypothetical protein KDD48_03210 [Bdellovibrionales bacterium]|nr:hypothetical protein [Bdellovibrionales bacterium]
MTLNYDHDEIVKNLALAIEKDPNYSLVKYFTPANDAKTDLIGSFYPDITSLRKEGRQKIMIEVQTPYSFEDSDEIRRLESLSNYCKTNSWEFYIACPDQATRDLTKKKIEGRNIHPKTVWTLEEVPFRKAS